MSFRKIVTVTGGNGGIGYETIKALLGSQKPYHIIMGSRSLEKAKVAIETLQSEYPQATNTIEAIQIDLASDNSIEAAFKQVENTHGRIDILVNNAGM
jgi:NAD(P)-dependent dehydrogenase (short-subunit alcohol dehydrogenase family)